MWVFSFLICLVLTYTAHKREVPNDLITFKLLNTNVEVHAEPNGQIPSEILKEEIVTGGMEKTNLNSSSVVILVDSVPTDGTNSSQIPSESRQAVQNVMEDLMAAQLTSQLLNPGSGGSMDRLMTAAALDRTSEYLEMQAINKMIGQYPGEQKPRQKVNNFIKDIVAQQALDSMFEGNSANAAAATSANSIFGGQNTSPFMKSYLTNQIFDGPSESALEYQAMGQLMNSMSGSSKIPGKNSFATGGVRHAGRPDLFLTQSWGQNTQSWGQNSRPNNQGGYQNPASNFQLNGGYNNNAAGYPQNQQGGFFNGPISHAFANIANSFAGVGPMMMLDVANIMGGHDPLTPEEVQETIQNAQKMNAINRPYNTGPNVAGMNYGYGNQAYPNQQINRGPGGRFARHQMYETYKNVFRRRRQNLAEEYYTMMLINDGGLQNQNSVKPANGFNSNFPVGNNPLLSPSWNFGPSEFSGDVPSWSWMNLFNNQQTPPSSSNTGFWNRITGGWGGSTGEASPQSYLDIIKQKVKERIALEFTNRIKQSLNTNLTPLIDAKNTITDGVSNKITDISNTINQEKDYISGIVGQKIIDATAAMNNAKDNMTSAFGNRIPNIKENVNNAKKTISDGITSAQQSAQDAVNDVKNQFTSGEPVGANNV